MQPALHPRRFRSTADHYLAGRPPYATRLIHRVAALAGLAPSHRVLDLGCGPGQLARAFAPMVREVVALDPEPEMLRIARQAAAAIPNISFAAAGSGDLTAALGPFRLAVMGRSFHWMDRAATLGMFDRLIGPGGAIACFHTQHARVPENAWVADYDAIRRRYAGDDPDRPGSATTPWVRHEAFFLASPFSQLEACTIYERRTLDPCTLIDRALSMGSSSADRLGSRTEAMVAELTQFAQRIAPVTELTEVIKSIALIGHRRG